MICSFDNHLSTYRNFCLANAVMRLLCSFVMNVWRLRIAPSCVDVGEFASQYGVGWTMCICGVLSGFSLSVPSLASVSTISLPLIPLCARTLCMCIVCGV